MAVGRVPPWSVAVAVATALATSASSSPSASLGVASAALLPRPPPPRSPLVHAAALGAPPPPSGGRRRSPATLRASVRREDGGEGEGEGDEDDLRRRLRPPTAFARGVLWPSAGATDGVGGISEDGEVDAHKEDDDEFEDEDDEYASVLDSVLKVHCTHSDPDYLIPWQRLHQTTSTSSGFVVDVPGLGLRVMTNAHAVEHGSMVRVQRRGDDAKHEAVVEAVGHECDLALLRVDSLLGDDGGENSDEDEDDGPRRQPRRRAPPAPLDLGPLPALQDEVEVLGYPAGGDSLSVTSGVVSRIEVQEYDQAGARLLAVQIDAAINPGNSGGPVIDGNLDVVGVAFQGLDGDDVENIGYVVPATVVSHFLEDVRRNEGRYTGFCRLGVQMECLESEAYRKSLGMTMADGSEERSGVVVREVNPTSAAKELLRPDDVLLAVDGVPVANDGKIPFRRGERVDLSCYVSTLFEGDVARVLLLRDGKELELDVPVSPSCRLVPAHFDGDPPPYLICAGLVFTALSVPYLRAEDAWDDYVSRQVTHLLRLVDRPPRYEDEEVVVLAQVLAHRANLGYGHLTDLHLKTYNGREVRSLRHLDELVRESGERDEPFMRFEFEPDGRVVVMERGICEEATRDVCEEHSIRKPCLLRGNDKELWEEGQISNDNA